VNAHGPEPDVPVLDVSAAPPPILEACMHRQPATGEPAPATYRRPGPSRAVRVGRPFDRWIREKSRGGNESRRIAVKDSPGAHRLLHETGSRTGSPLWCMGARQRRHRGRGLVSGQGGHRAVVDQSGRCAGNRRLIDAKARQRAYELGGTLAATGDLTLIAISNHKSGSRLLHAPDTSVGRLIIR